jgi:hypothetical protein
LFLFFIAVVNTPSHEATVSGKKNKPYDIHYDVHDLLLCLIAIANNNMVPGQCAEY